MKQIKVSEATELQLDWLVAKAQGGTPVFRPHGNSKGATIYRSLGLQHAGIDFRPSTNWAQGGPIIERELTKVFRNVGGKWSAMILKEVPIPTEDRGTSLALTQRAQWNGAGITPLIAAMRCYVTSKLGETAEVPEELA